MTSPPLSIVHAGSEAFSKLFGQLARRGETDLDRVEGAVREILAAVRRGGDRAVLDYVARFEGRQPTQLLRRDFGGEEALASLEPTLQQALRTAAERIASYHARQADQLRTFEYDEAGVTLSSRVTPVQRAGIYAPGGKASYPSSVLMTAVPARVAGVPEIIVACPDTSAEVLAACYLAGVTAIVDAGGAQAIAALAYGTESVPRVDKIVGPGNAYVACAKRLAFGAVDIDGIAGPSEILVVADDTADPKVVAADLLSQAEHDEEAYALLVTLSQKQADDVAVEVEKQLALLPRREIAEASIRN